MKHIILITAYTESEHLLEQLNLYDADADLRVYIHWDKKTATPEVLNNLSTHPSVRKVCSHYAVNWGGRNQLAAMVALCRYALKDLKAEGNPDSFIHSISGTDLLMRSPREVKTFFDARRDKGFMEYFGLPAPQWYEGGMSRLTLRWVLLCFSSAIEKSADKLIMSGQVPPCWNRPSAGVRKSHRMTLTTDRSVSLMP